MFTKKLLLCFCLMCILSGCNSLMCEWRSPNNMTDRELDYCKAAVSAPNN